MAKTSPPESTRFQPGQSGNPGGRPSLKWMREWLEKPAKEGMGARREHYMNALFATAIDRSHKQHVAACELLAAYDFGKPTQAVELSGPEGGDIPFSNMQTVVFKLAELASAKKS